MRVDVDLFWQRVRELGDMDALALATSLEDEVTVRPVGALAYGGELLIRTDEDSEKALQMKGNPRVAVSLGLEFYLRGQARFIGKCSDTQSPEVLRAREAYTARWPDAFGEGDSFLSGKEVFIAIRPTHLSQWVYDDKGAPVGFVQQALV